MPVPARVFVVGSAGPNESSLAAAAAAAAAAAVAAAVVSGPSCADVPRQHDAALSLAYAER